MRRGRPPVALPGQRAVAFTRKPCSFAGFMIEVENLTRVFRTYKKQPGFWGGVKGLFKREFEETRAADGVSFRSRKANSSASSDPTARARPRR